MRAPDDVYWPELGLTLDENSDYVLIKNLIEHFGDSNNLFSCLDAVNYIKDNPELIDIIKMFLGKVIHK